MALQTATRLLKKLKNLSIGYSARWVTRKNLYQAWLKKQKMIVLTRKRRLSISQDNFYSPFQTNFKLAEELAGRSKKIWKKERKIALITKKISLVMSITSSLPEEWQQETQGTASKSQSNKTRPKESHGALTDIDGSIYL